MFRRWKTYSLRFLPWRFIANEIVSGNEIMEFCNQAACLYQNQSQREVKTQTWFVTLVSIVAAKPLWCYICKYSSPVPSCIAMTKAQRNTYPRSNSQWTSYISYSWASLNVYWEDFFKHWPCCEDITLIVSCSMWPHRVLSELWDNPFSILPGQLSPQHQLHLHYPATPIWPYADTLHPLRIRAGIQLRYWLPKGKFSIDLFCCQ